MSAIRWVTEGRLKRADCCTRWEGDGYKEVVLAEDYERLEVALTEMTLQRDSWKRIAESGLGLTSETSVKPSSMDHGGIGQVGCERDDGLLNIHGESETCEVCAAPETKGDANG